MTQLNFHRDGWLEGDIGDADEHATFTRLKITAANSIITRAFSKRGGGETDAINVPIFPLASYIARLWWPLLYEPIRARTDRAFAGRHRLDLPMHGYVFPSLGLCSAGDDAVLIDWALLENEHSPLKFLTPAPKEPLQVSRDDIEPELMNLVETALERLRTQSSAHVDLRDNWNRVKETLANPEQLGYCMAAGRLGIDPYDPEAPDIGLFAKNMPGDLFNDISEAIDVSALAATTKWTLDVQQRLEACPTVEVGAFGEPPRDDLNLSAGDIGYRAAKRLRAKLGLPKHPREAVAMLLGLADTPAAVLSAKGPVPMTGLTHRTNGVAHIGTIAASARQRHFRTCAATYLAWCSEPGDIRAGTVALTRRQQASRAFAAELVAPVDYLVERAGDEGFTEDDVENIAGNLAAPFDTVLWQAWRGGVTMPDVEPRAPRRRSFFDQALNVPIQ